MEKKNNFIVNNKIELVVGVPELAVKGAELRRRTPCTCQLHYVTDNEADKSRVAELCRLSRCTVNHVFV